MSDADIVPVKPEIEAGALVKRAGYERWYCARRPNAGSFWAGEAKRIDWMKAPTIIKNTSFSGDVSIKWFEDGTLNAAANCLDRHLADARRPGGDHLGGRRPGHVARTSPTGSCTSRSAAWPMRSPPRA